MSYADVRRIWDTFSEVGHILSAEQRDVLGGLLVREAGVLGLRGDGKPFTGVSNMDVLVLVAVDSDAVVWLVRVPEARLGGGLGEALAMLHGRVFAGAADLTAAQWDAAVRVLAALAADMNDADELAEWAHDEGATVTADEIESLWNRWAGCEVCGWEALRDAPARFCALRRAM